MQDIPYSKWKVFEAYYLKETALKDNGEEVNGKREKSNSILESSKISKKLQPFQWDWWCLSVEPCNIDKEYLENIKLQQVTQFFKKVEITLP